MSLPSASSTTRQRRPLQQRLLRLGKANLERQTRVPDRVARSGARAAVVAADQDLVGSALGHAGGDGADAGLADQLDRHARAGVGVLKIEDKLRQVLDGVDVVVRRRRNQADAGRGLTDLGDPGIDLLAGQVAALSGLGALGHLDLNLEGAAQVAARHAKARACHLLDGGILGVTVGQRGLATRSSPPSPELERPCRRFMAMAMHSCASLLMEPYVMAPVLKRRTMLSAGSTSSSETGVRPLALKSSRSRRRTARPVRCRRALYSLKVS